MFQRYFREGSRIIITYINPMTTKDARNKKERRSTKSTKQSPSSSSFRPKTNHPFSSHQPEQPQQSVSALSILFSIILVGTLLVLHANVMIDLSNIPTKESYPVFAEFSDPDQYETQVERYNHEKADYLFETSIWHNLYAMAMLAFSILLFVFTEKKYSLKMVSMSFLISSLLIVIYSLGELGFSLSQKFEIIGPYLILFPVILILCYFAIYFQKRKQRSIH